MDKIRQHTHHNTTPIQQVLPHAQSPILLDKITHKATVEQVKIGWGQFFKGRLSRQWINHKPYCATNGLTSTNVSTP